METSQKNFTAYRTIGEVAADLGLPPHVLRFWESKFTQIKPQKRRGGHRYYRPQDIETIVEIKSLLHDQGFTIKGAQKYLKDARSAAASGSKNGAGSTATAQMDGKTASMLGLLLKELRSIEEMLKA